jgi:hypothetical protein
LPVGSLFDVAGSALFPDDPLTMLAILNSRVARDLLNAINPTINHQAGDLSELPMPSRSSDEVRSHVARAIALQKQLDAFDETCPEFIAPMPWPDAPARHAAVVTELQSIEHQIEHAVRALYGLDNPGSADEMSTPVPYDDLDLARRWISFAIGQIVSRWEPHAAPIAHDVIPSLILPDDIRLVRDRMREYVGDMATKQIEQRVGGLENWLTGEFAVWHSRLYKSRPPYWILAGPLKIGLIFFADADSAQLEAFFSRLGLAGPIPRLGPIDDGIALNLCRLSDHLRDGNLRRRLKILATELSQGLATSVSPRPLRL